MMIHRLIGNVIGYKNQRRLDQFYKAGEFKSDLELVDFLDAYCSDLSLGHYNSFDGQEVSFETYISSFTPNYLETIILLCHLRRILLYCRQVNHKNENFIFSKLNLLEEGPFNRSDIYKTYHEIFKEVKYPKEIRKWDYFIHGGPVDKAITNSRLITLSLKRQTSYVLED